jgi:sigma-B regulation protein RsbU (phosphoserine phosphatase)
MLVLLIAAVLPMLAVRAVQAVSTYRLQSRIAQDMREQLNDQAQKAMQHSVEGYAKSLDQVSKLGLSLLRNQASEVEQRLLGPVPRDPMSIPSVTDFARYEHEGRGPYRIQPSERHAMVSESGDLKPLMISYDTQVVLSFEETVTNESQLQLDRLASMSRVYREIHDKVDQTILWQYTTLESGMHFSYPAKSAFPEDYSPKLQAWYARAVEAKQAITSQPYVDAATGQLVITIATPVYERARRLAGVTAIDLRVSKLLDPAAINTEWADEANLIVVASHPARNVKRRMPRERFRQPRVEEGARPNRTRPEALDRRDGADLEADTSYPADIYVVADLIHDHLQQSSADLIHDHLQQSSADLIETVNFDSEDDRKAVSNDLVDGKSGVRQVFIDGQDRMIAYGKVGSMDEGRPVFAMIIAPTRTIHQPAEHAVKQVQENLTESLVTTGGILVVLLLIVFVSAFLMSFRLTRPIRELAEASNRVASGDLDARVTVKRKDELGQLGNAFNKMVPALHDRLKIRESLEVAMQVQQSLLPVGSPNMKGLDIAGESQYCDETGGDYYDFIELDQIGPDSLAIAVGDVTGHGIAAALLMATGRALIRSHANTTGSIGDVFTQVNKQLCDSEFTGRFMTIMYLIVENPGETDGPIRVRFLSAGHDPVIVYRPAEDSFFELAGTDIPLGIDATWQYNEHKSDTLQQGDILVVGTDGIWECFNPDNQQFGKGRMRDTIRNAAQGSAQDIGQAITNACESWRGSREQNDDITLVVVKLVGSDTT